MGDRKKPLVRDVCDACGQAVAGGGENRRAAEVTVAALREQLEDVDEALIAAFLSLASSVDSADAGGDLWREYRAHAQALREVAAGGSDDDTAAFLIEVRTPVRDSPKRRS